LLSHCGVIISFISGRVRQMFPIIGIHEARHFYVSPTFSLVWIASGLPTNWTQLPVPRGWGSVLI
jgi:hypothetical protein